MPVLVAPAGAAGCDEAEEDTFVVVVVDGVVALSGAWGAADAEAVPFRVLSKFCCRLSKLK